MSLTSCRTSEDNVKNESSDFEQLRLRFFAFTPLTSSHSSIFSQKNLDFEHNKSSFKSLNKFA